MKQCKWCGRNFAPKNNYHQFCTETCRTKNALVETEGKTTSYCNSCEADLPIDEFYIRVDIGRPRSRCRKCERYFKGRTPEQKRQRRANLYGITMERLSELESITSCEICGKDTNDRHCIDHCHSTGIVRGVLCGNCNTALGMFNDSIESMKKAIDYVRKAKKQEWTKAKAFSCSSKKKSSS